MATFTNNPGRSNCSADPVSEVETRYGVVFIHVTCAHCGLDYRVQKDGA